MGGVAPLAVGGVAGAPGLAEGGPEGILGTLEEEGAQPPFPAEGVDVVAPQDDIHPVGGGLVHAAVQFPGGDAEVGV